LNKDDMNSENFREYLNDPSLLYQVPYEELKSLSLEYPYNVHLRWLLLQKSRMEHRPDAQKALEKAAVYSIDRRALYRFVQTPYEKSQTPFLVFNEDFLELKDLATLQEALPAPAGDLAIERPLTTEPAPVFREPPVAPKTEAVEEEELSFDFSSIPLIPPAEAAIPPPLDVVAEEIVPVIAPDPEPAHEESFVHRVAEDAVAISSLVEYRAALAAAEAVLEKAFLVAPAAPLPKNAFRSWPKSATPVLPPENEAPKAPPPVAMPDKKTKKTQDKVAEIARLSVTENADLVSETLADLLAAQQLYDKAVKMYERLILKFPEKSDYFAAKIEKLKRR